MKVEEEAIPTKPWHPQQTSMDLVKRSNLESSPNFNIKVWWEECIIWRCHQTSTSKFGECSDMEMPLNFTCQSLTMDVIHKGKNLVSRKV